MYAIRSYYGHVPHTHQIGCMARRAGRGLARHDLAVDDRRTTEPHELPAARKAAFRHVGDEPRPGIPQQLGALLVTGHLDSYNFV